MSCPIHDRCTCYSASLQYTATAASTNASQFAPQTNNIFVGYEWATPLVATTSAAWYPLELIQPPTLLSGQDTLLQSGGHRLDNAHRDEALSNRNMYHHESHGYEREQKQALRSREQIAAQHPCPTPYIQGFSRMAVPGNYSEPLVPLFRTHQSGTASGFANFDGLSQFESIMNSDQLSPLDEPPPPYPNNNSLLVGNLQSDVFSQSGLLPTERHLTDDGSISGTASPLAPVPLRHSSLYQVLKQNTPISPAQGTQQSGVSLIAHALGPQELQARQAPPVRTPLLGNKRGPTITSDSALSGGQLSTPTSLAPVAAAVEPPTLPLLHALPPSSTSVRAAATAQSPVSSATPPCAEAVPAQKEPIAVVTPTQAHTLVQSIPELTTQDYDTLPRLRKLQPALPGSAKEDQSAASSPLSPLSSRPSSSVGAPATSSTSRGRASTSTGKSALDSAFNLPLLGRKRPVLRAKLACLFCRRRKIQCRPVTGDNQDHTCQQCAKRSRQCEYPEMTWRGRGRKRSRSELEESDDYEEEEDTPARSKTRWNT